MTTVSLYTFGNAANVSANNFTTLYNSGAGTINPQVGYGNANVESFLAAGTDGGNTIGNIVAVGNVSAGNVLANVGIYSANYYWANGAPLDVQGNYSNANVAAYLPTYTGNLAGGNIAINQNAVVSGNLTTGLNIIAGGNVQATGNIRTTGPAGNITGAQFVSAQYYLGDGGLLSNVTAANIGTLTTLTVTGNITGGNLNTAGNVTGNYILGNGSQLTGLPATYGNANVATFLANFGSNVIVTTGNVSAGNVSTTGNVTVSGSLNSDDITSANITVYGDQVITGNLTVQGTTTTINSNTISTNDKNITVANNQSTAANVDGAGLDAGNPAIATWRFNALTNSWQSNVGVTPTGNLTQELGNNQNRWSTVFAGAVSASGNVSATGNVTGNYFLGNGSLLTGLPATYGNANVAANLAAFANNPISTSGNITSGNTITAKVDFGSGGGNLNLDNLYLANTLGSYTNILRLVNNQNTGYMQIGNATTTGGVFRFSKWFSTNTAVEINTANNHVGINKNSPTVELDVNGTVCATGNVTGSYFLGNGSQLTGIVSSYGNANVAANLAAFGSNPISTTGNITAGNFLTTGLLSATGNITSAGNVAANYYIGNGSLLTGIATSSYGNANVEAYLASGTNTSNIITTANVQGGNVIGAVWTNTITGTVAAGNIDISPDGAGHVNLNADVVRIGDNNTDAVLATRGTGNLTIKPHEGDANQSVINIVNGLNGNIELTLNGTGNVNTARISASGNITADGFIGNGAGLTNIAGANVTGTVANAAYATTAGTATSATTAGTVTTAAQPNITSVGTLTSITSTGNISTTGNVTAGYYFGDGSQLTGLPATYGNANVAANLAAFGSNPISTTGNITAGYFVGNGSALTGVTATLPANITGTSVSVTGNITGSYYFGNGSQLTGISASLPANVTANVFQSQVYSYGNATGTITPDISLGSIQTMTLTGNITLNALSNVASGQSATFIINQDATGNRLLTSTWKFASNVRTLSTAANATDMISVTYVGTTYYASLIRGFA